jgi:CSLREA domain-containing protein
MPAASAANFTVNSLADTPDANTSDGVCADSAGACTLRAAIQQANADPAPDNIGIAVGGVLNLGSALPEIRTDMTISYTAPGGLLMRRNVSQVYFRIFSVAAGVTATISRITARGGTAPLSESGGPLIGGGGIYNSGDLTLTGVTVVDNTTIGTLPSVTPVAPAGGGGIHNDGVLTMNDCVVSDNHTGSEFDGAGFDGGDGGGVYNAGTLTMTDSRVVANYTGNGGDGSTRGGSAGSGGSGGGIYNAPDGARQVSATLTNCTVVDNFTGNGGAVVPGPQAEMSLSGIGGQGGGIYNASAMTIDGSSVSGNWTGFGADAPQGKRTQAGKGGSGGGIYNDIPAGGGEMRLTNCVVSGNRTGKGGVGSGEVQSHGDGGDGGGIANPSAGSILKMSQSTVIGNQTGLMGDGGGRDGVGGGIYGVPRVRSSLVALNSVRFPSNLSDMAGGPFLSSGYNYMGFSGVSCCYTGTDRGGSGGAASTFVKLDPDTLVPLPDSVLIDAGLARDIDDNPVSTDRRGAARPFDFTSIAPQPGGDNGDIGAFERQGSEPTPTPAPTTVQFLFPFGSAQEGYITVEFIVTRTGPTDGTTVAEYVVTADPTPTAHWRGDFTYARGRLVFGPGQVWKLLPVFFTQDAYAEGPENFMLKIIAVSGGQVGTPDTVLATIEDEDETDGTDNPIDDTRTFVTQHYHDFLSRQPDPHGEIFWTGRLDECGGEPACLERRRVDVSAAFFLSIEFKNTGYFVVRANAVGLGDQPDALTFLKFQDEAQQVARGVIVGEPDYQSVLEGNKQRYAEEFVQRPVFQSAHAVQTAAQYVDSLFANAVVQPTTAERDAAISAFGGGGTAGQAATLRSVAESGSVYNKLYNPSFVLMQYFGYLRRSPKDPPDSNLDGYNFWLGKLDSVTLPGEDVRDDLVALARVRRAEMVRAFLRSAEYRGRFGGDPSRGNP